MHSYKELINELDCKYLEKVSAKDITSYKTGGIIDIIIYPSKVDDLVKIFDFINKNSINYFIAGNCTNILVSDYGFRGVFIKTDEFKKIRINNTKIYVECGVLWDDMIRICVEKNLAGLEKTSDIPGSVGGAVRMNAGAFGQECFDCLNSFNVFDLKTHWFKKINKIDIKYGYRYVEGIERYFIIDAEFEFRKSDCNLLSIREDIINKRKEKQPLDYPSAGSVFKRPVNNYASKLIEECGLKGLRVGGAMVSTKHAGFIINYDNASSSDIYNLIITIKEEVYKKTNILLELEQILVGKF